MDTVAYHEAGHAFMAIFVGAELRSVTIDPDRDDGPRREGDTQVAWRRANMTSREYCEKAILVTLAGPVAEMIYTGDPFHPAVVAEWSSDWSQAWEIAGTILPDEQRRLTFLEQVCRDLHRQLRRDDHWAAIAAVADNLEAYETLEAEEVREIVAAWWPA